MENIVAPMANLTSPWNMYGLIFLPNIKNREELSDLGLTEGQLRYILTREHIKDNTWLDNLNIKSLADTNDEDYKKLASIFVGSLCVTFRCQEVDHTKEAEERLARQVQKRGKPNQATQEWPNEEIKFLDRKKKSLSSIISIIYLNMDELTSLSSKEAFEAFIGDFGCGKTDINQAAARKAAEDEDTR